MILFVLFLVLSVRKNPLIQHITIIKDSFILNKAVVKPQTDPVSSIITHANSLETSNRMVRSIIYLHISIIRCLIHNRLVK